MEENLTYYDFAMNDYNYLKFSIDNNLMFNSMCSNAQNIVERFLKHIIEPKAMELGNTKVMKAHDLILLKTFIQEHLPDFSIDWGTVIQCNGFYFNVRYPGDNSFFVNERNVLDCWNAVNETKNAVDRYLSINSTSSSITKKDVLDTLKDSINFAKPIE